MNLTIAYAGLSILGALVPLWQIGCWIGAHGFDVSSFFQAMFANRISSAFALDVLISAVVVFVFVAYEGRRRGLTRLWLPIAGTLLAGVSCGLPLFLAMREQGRSGLRG